MMIKKKEDAPILDSKPFDFPNFTLKNQTEYLNANH